MKETASIDYRTRIYAAYVTALGQALAPARVASLWPRLPYFRRIIRSDISYVRKAAICERGSWHDAMRSPYRFRAPGTNPLLRRQSRGRI